MAVVELIYFLRSSSATLPCSIWSKASATASQVGVVVLSNQQISTSVLQRSLSPQWFFSMAPSWWLFKSRFTPSKCQSKTDFKAFLRVFKVSVSGAVGGQKNQQKIHKRFSSLYQCGRSVAKLTLYRSLSRDLSHIYQVYEFQTDNWNAVTMLSPGSMAESWEWNEASL